MVLLCELDDNTIRKLIQGSEMKVSILREEIQRIGKLITEQLKYQDDLRRILMEEAE